MLPLFQNPFLLWGLAAAAVPILIHLLSRRRYQTQQWAAMHWLLAAAKRNKRRMQIQNLLLLLLRTLAILLLALALTKPIFTNSPLALGTSTQAHLYLVIDNSASMGARTAISTALDEAITNATALLSEIGPDDPVTLVLSNSNVESDIGTGRPRVVLPATRDHAKVRRVLAELRPAPARADLVEMLKVLDEAMRESEPLPKKVAILSDTQRCTIDGLGGGSETSEDALRATLERLKVKGAEIVLMPCGGDAANVAITSLRPEEDRDIVEGAAVVFVADVVNYSSRPARVEVRFLLDGRERGEFSQWVDLPPRPAGSESPVRRPVRFVTNFRADSGDDGTQPGPRSAAGTSHTVEARIAADGLPVDDARAYAFRVRPPIEVLAVDGDPNPGRAGAERETYWLEPTLALREGGPIAVTRIAEPEYRALEDLGRYDMVVLANVKRPAPSDVVWSRLSKYVAGGGALFLTVGEGVVAEVWNRELHRDGEGLLPARLKQAHYSETLRIQLDLSENKHPLLVDITHPDNAAFFESPILNGYMEIEGLAEERQSRVAATYTDLAKSPALIDKRYGKGRVLLLTTTIDIDWGGLPGSLLYAPLLHETVYWLTALGNTDRNLLAYQSYTRSFPDNLEDFRITAPDGTPVAAGVDRPADAPPYMNFGATTQLGLYETLLTFKAPDPVSSPPPPQEAHFAVSLSPIESDLRRVRPEELTARWPELLGVADTFDDAVDEVRSSDTPIHRELLIAAILMLIAEMFVARNIGKGRRASA